MSDERPQVRPFAAFLQEQRGGDTHQELSQALADVVEGVIAHGKPGSVTLTLKVKRAGRGDSRTVFVADAVTSKVPQGERAEALFFADAHGNLSRSDPRQLELTSLREVPRPEAREAEQQ